MMIDVILIKVDFIVMVISNLSTRANQTYKTVVAVKQWLVSNSSWSKTIIGVKQQLV